MNETHPGDVVLNAVSRSLSGLYSASEAKIEKAFTAFLRPKLSALQPKDGESEKDYIARFMTVFTGARWTLARRRIARELTSARVTVNERINSSLVEAFAAGMNEAAYTLSLSGCDMLPVTAAVVSALVADRVISLNTTRLKTRMLLKYNEQRTQSAVHAVLAQDIAVSEFPKQAARHVVNARKQEMIASARALIYGASDSGAYYAGIEAQKSGVEIEKTWLSIMDMRVRKSHARLHGTTIPLNEKFHGDYGLLRFPHDPNAVPAEVYNCRCRMAVHPAGKSPGEYSRRLLPSQTAGYREWRERQLRKAENETELARLHALRLRG